MLLKSGDIWQTTLKWIVIPVNTEGVAGAGLSYQMKQRYPDTFRVYQAACAIGHFKANGIMLSVVPFDQHSLLMLPTKEQWRLPARLDLIERGLREFVHRLRGPAGLSTFGGGVAFPALGCGNGGLRWADVRPLMHWHLEGLPIPIEAYTPQGGQ